MPAEPEDTAKMPINSTDAAKGGETTVRLFPSCRMTVTIMMFMACLITYVLRLNMGFALVCMVKETPQYPILPVDEFNITETGNYSLTTSNYSLTTMTSILHEEVDICKGGAVKAKKHGHKQGEEFEWDKTLQGNLLGAFFYGYIVTQVPAGWLCDRIGGKVVLGTGLGVVSGLTMFLPESARFDPYAMLGIRVLQGMFAAVSFPAIHSLVGNWAPPTERGLLMAIAYSGMYVGSLLTFPVCGLLCDYGFAGGWPSVFYVTGMSGVVYVIALLFLVYDGYEKHPRINSNERNYLQKNLEGHHDAGTHIVIPWVKILTSPPVWAIIITHLCANWGLYTLVLNLPTFMKEVLKFDVKENGFLSSLPYLCTFLVNLFCGKLTDFLRRKNLCSWTALRKIFNTIGLVIPGLCTLLITFLHCEQRYIVVAALTACQAMSGFAYSGGFFYNHVDLSPQHAGILMGISNMFATIPGILSPLLVGVLTKNKTREEWQTIFYIGVGTYFLGTIVYLIWGSGERQEWSYGEDELKAQKELQNLNDNSNEKLSQAVSSV